MAIDYQERIPNNVDLAENRTLQRALEHWQPRFLDWWRGMGPSDFLDADVYLRTATGSDGGTLSFYPAYSATTVKGPGCGFMMELGAALVRAGSLDSP